MPQIASRTRPQAALLGALMICCRGTGEREPAEPGPSTESVPPAAVAPIPGSTGDTCARIEGQRYASVQELPCGPPHDDGTEARCRWQLRFSNGSYTWQQGDLVITGEYTCDGAGIRALAPESSTGRLDAGTGRLVWEGMEYAPLRDP
jgi:hypothetical protein